MIPIGAQELQAARRIPTVCPECSGELAVVAGETSLTCPHCHAELIIDADTGAIYSRVKERVQAKAKGERP